MAWIRRLWPAAGYINGFYGMRETVRQRLADIHSKSGEKVSLIGWSLGGIFARDLAVKMPRTPVGKLSKKELYDEINAKAAVSEAAD